jgi:hypothetical protein
MYKKKQKKVGYTGEETNVKQNCVFREESENNVFFEEYRVTSTHSQTDMYVKALSNSEQQFVM